MKDEVEKLLIELQVKNATSVAINGHLNEKDLVSTTKKLLALFQTAQVEAVRAAYLKGYNSGYKTRLYRERKPKKTGGIAIANELDRLARLGEK